MTSRSTLRALLLMMVIPMFACQFLQPAPKDCRVKMPSAGWVAYRHGDEINFNVGGMKWRANVDCSAGRLVDGQPVRPERAREILIPVEDSTYHLITADPDVSMSEYRADGSHVRIDLGDSYYVAVLSAWPGILGNATVRYFIGGQSDAGIVPLYCYDQTENADHTSVPVLASMWTVSKAMTVSLVCSGPGFILELSTDVSDVLLKQGPTPVPATPAPTITPEPPGGHAGGPMGS